MNEPLHPLRLGEILDRTAQMYRSRFLVFLGIATIPAGIMFVFFAGLFGLIAWMGSNGKQGMTSGIVWAFVFVLSLLVVPATLGSSALGEAAMSDAAAKFFLGHPIAIRNSYKTAWSKGWRYLGLFLLQGLSIMAVPMIVFCVVIGIMIAAKVSGFGANDPSPLFGGLLFLSLMLLGVFAVWMLLRLCLAFPASVVEQAGAWSALKRGTRLSEGTRWRILVLYILGIFLNQILTWIVAVPAMIALAFIPSMQGQAHARVQGMILTFVLYGAMFAVRALTKPVYGIALTLFYFDQRIRKEGFDIEWMMQQVGMVPPPAPSVPDAPDISLGVAERAAAIPAGAEAPAVEILSAVGVQSAPVSVSPEEGEP
jgi:hypothetical protein